MPIQSARPFLLFSHVAFLTLVIALALPTVVRSQASSTQSTDDKEKLNVLAHKLLAAALNVNALGGSELKPWHIRIEYTPGTEKTIGGTVEEWHASQYQWARTYASEHPERNGKEWRVSHTERYEAVAKHITFPSEFLNLRVTRPVINPLYQASTLPASAELTVSRIASSDGQSFNCVSLANPETFGSPGSAEWILPTLCFDKNLYLRLVSAKDTFVQFEDFQPFLGRAVARTIRVIWHGQVNVTMKVVQLEELDPAAHTDLLKPAADAVLQPYTIEAGDPPLESVYEQGTTIPLLSDGKPFRGVLSVGAIIRKDGTVKVSGGMYGAMQNLYDAVSVAVSRWKYKPYIIDGKPVEVRANIPYIVDGKPFVPSYEKPGKATGIYTP